ncbi:hypothetical protein PIROE2DRAFT_64142 [Piromyces sp. E2]|nr:hypothetical protein PIROE2DRAFT_64142 [Piromyces sp. E2]|eukprot:OUM58849.1 hypothetical protein PIROE2DRAFT_64142 [Piromyces sp. E2]
MGSIIDSIEMYDKFKYLRNQKYFVDKSNIINIFNNLINKDGRKNVCITKPRRFGKTSIAAMLVTYYSKGINSQKIFNKYKVSRGIDFQELFDKKLKEKFNFAEKKVNKKKYEKKIKKKVEKEIIKEKKRYKKFQGKYHTLYFDFSCGVKSYKTLKKYLKSINLDLYKDIKKVYPNSEILNDYDNNIYKNLKNLYIETGEKFVIIIDEWDYIISNNLFTHKERDKYISFLRDLIKDRGYAAFVYMTGILPIAKELSQSTINFFNEYSMLDDEMYYKYFGFTEREVRALCGNDEGKYKELENWYNGYKAFNGRFDELINIINFNIDGVKDEVLDLIKGNEISIELENFGAEDLQKESEENKRGEMNEKQNNDEMKIILYSKMVTFGFLTYYDGKISIPNKELKEKFIKALSKNSEMKYYYDLIKISDDMLKETFNKNAKAMCKILEEAHLKKIKSGDKMDHGNLKRVIDFAYFKARMAYHVDEEVGKGEGDIDFIFYQTIR